MSKLYRQIAERFLQELNIQKSKLKPYLILIWIIVQLIKRLYSYKLQKHYVCMRQKKNNSIAHFSKELNWYTLKEHNKLHGVHQEYDESKLCGNK